MQQLILAQNVHDLGHVTLFVKPKRPTAHGHICEQFVHPHVTKA